MIKIFGVGRGKRQVRRRARAPRCRRRRVMRLRLPQAVAIECEAGSLVCWHGNTWHGAFNRQAGGLRVSIPLVIARPHVRTQENLIDQIPKKILDRNSARFSILTHQGLYKGWANQQEAISGGERAMRYQAAYVKELGVNPARHSESLFV